MKGVSDENDLMIITLNGITIRLPISSISVLGRATQGVRVINLKGNDKIASVARVTIEETVETEEEEQENDTTENEENNE